MKGKGSINKSCFSLLFSGIICIHFTVCAGAADLGVPQLSEPLQKERFFNQERLSIDSSSSHAKSLLEPQLSVSHDVRENDLGADVKQTTHRVHGEAGGKLNIIGDISLVTVARIPVFTHEATGSTRTSDGTTSSELLKSTRRLSWRSELGVPLGEGVNLNLFYDNSTFSKIDRPGVDEREEKFGTRFIFKFK